MIGPNSVHDANTPPPPPLRQRPGLVIAARSARPLEDAENESSSLEGKSYRLLQVINNG